MFTSLKQKKSAISGIENLMNRLVTGMNLDMNTRESIICYLVELKYKLLRETKMLDREKLQSGEVLTKRFQGTTIMLLRNEEDDTLDIYYSRPGYPFMFAFGVSRKMFGIQSAIGIAEDSIEEYGHLFN